MAKVNVSLPDELLDDVDALAAELDSSRSGLVREATARYVTQVRAEQAARERAEAIRAAAEQMRDIAKSVPDGTDGATLIRADRDGDYGSGR
jgi:metal-responsive CopG/Arc/MetJ family transcriptional regulator